MRIDKNFVRDLLKCIDRLQDGNGYSCASPNELLTQPELQIYGYDSAALKKYLDYCDSNNYFIGFKCFIHGGFKLSDLSEAGYDFIDGKDTSMKNHASIFTFNAPVTATNIAESIDQSTVNNQNYGDASSIVVQSSTINIGAQIADIEKIIASKPAVDQEQLAEIVELLKFVSEQDEPIKKGLLAKFSDGLQKHSDLITAIGNWAVAILTARK